MAILQATQAKWELVEYLEILRKGSLELFQANQVWLDHGS